MKRQPGARHAPRTRRLPGRWLAALLIAGAVALLAPGVSSATASQSSTAASNAASGCRGITPAIIPATGFIADPARDQGGHFWWRWHAASRSVCIGTVVEWVRYTATATKTWNVTIYDALHLGGQVAAQQTFTLGRGWYYWSFGVHQAYKGLHAVCVTAVGSFGAPTSSSCAANAAWPSNLSGSPAPRAAGPERGEFQVAEVSGGAGAAAGVSFHRADR